MTPDNIFNKVLQSSSIPAECPKRQRFHSPASPFARVFCTREPHLKGPPVKPKPVLARRRNHRDPFVTQRRIQIQVTNALEELLLQKPFLHPGECGIIIFYCDHHGALAHKPEPKRCGYGPQPYAYTANDHEQQPARGEFIPTGQHTFKNLKHCRLFLIGLKPQLRALLSH